MSFYFSEKDGAMLVLKLEWAVEFPSGLVKAQITGSLLQWV